MPDLATFRSLPWRPGAGARRLRPRRPPRRARSAPRRAPCCSRAVDRLAALGYTAQVGVEIEFHLLDAEGGPLDDGLQPTRCRRPTRSTRRSASLFEGLCGVLRLRGGQLEYGAGAVRGQPAPRRSAGRRRPGHALQVRRQGARAPRRRASRRSWRSRSTAASGSSMHLHVSLWRDGEPAFAPDGHDENALHRAAIGGIMRHLPGITLVRLADGELLQALRGPVVRPDAPRLGRRQPHRRRPLAPRVAEATRIELRTGAADAQPHWAVAGLLAAVVAGLEAGVDGAPARRGRGQPLRRGRPAAATLVDGVAGRPGRRDASSGSSARTRSRLRRARASAEWERVLPRA